MFYRIRKIYRPEIFQGGFQKKDYFEGWYFKLADKKADNLYAVIPGVSISDIKNDSHSFIQVMDGKNASSKYFRFDFGDFKYCRETFQVSIGNNYFSSQKLCLDIKEGSSVIKATLEFNNLHPWPKSLFAPGAMGWYAFVPFMECYHGVVSMSHLISGCADFGKGGIDFSGGKGYIEKDWGKSFPSGWIWLQSNHFDNNDTSIMLSIARIPWRKKSFTGFICGLLHNEKMRVFATYNGSSIAKLKVSSNEFSCMIQKGKTVLEVSAKRKSSAELASPVMGAMDGRITESMDAHVDLKLETKEFPGKSTPGLYADRGIASGLEIMNPEALT